MGTAHPFTTMPTRVFSNQFLISMNLHQHAKNQAFLSFCSRDIFDLKILQFDWTRAFQAIFQEPEASQI